MTALLPDDPATLLERLNAETFRYTAPGPDFRPIGADEGLLETFGIPPEPDQQAEPELHAFWEKMFTPPLEYVPAEFDFNFPLSGHFQRDGARAVGTRQQPSRNWSGVSISARESRMFTDVLGAWEVPTVSAPADGEYRSSTWIGLDGQRSYRDATLPQIGTAQFVTRAGSVSTFTTNCWVQWWPTIFPLTITGMPIAPGDLIACWIRVLDPLTVQLVIANVKTPSTTMYAPFQLSVPAIPWPGSPVPVQPEVAGATAEWVMERPTVWGSNVLYELPLYDKVDFDPCLAISRVAPGAAGRLERITGPTLIHMYKVAENPHRAVTISKAERLGPYAFRTIPPPP